MYIAQRLEIVELFELYGWYYKIGIIYGWMKYFHKKKILVKWKIETKYNNLLQTKGVD